MTTSTRRTSSPRHNSSVSAAREGWHKWAAKHWGWFAPILAVIGAGRGTWKTVRWGAPRAWKAARWGGSRLLQRQDRVARWLDRKAVQLLDRHPKTRGLADKLRRA